MIALATPWVFPWPLRPAVARRGERPVTPAPSDAELVARIGHADREAFRLFYERYAARLLAYARQLARQREAPEDVVQEVFLTVWRKAATFRAERGDVAGWLYTITRNRLVDRWRRGAGLQQDPGFDLLSLEAPERDGAGRLLDLSVRQALAELDGEQRQAIELAYFGGLTYDETARRLGLPLGTLKSRIRVGLAKMRELLQPGAPA